MALTSFAAVAAAATAALALVIAFARFRRACMGSGRASKLLWTLFPRFGPFPGCAILPLGTLAARRPLLSPLLSWWALGARVTVLTVLALRSFTALILPASLTLVRTVIAPTKAVAVAAVAVATVAVATVAIAAVAIATFRPGHLLLAV